MLLIKNQFRQPTAQNQPTIRCLGPGNGSPSATNVVVFGGGLAIIRFSKVLRLFHFTTDRH